jgi:hypothetical protein
MPMGLIETGCSNWVASLSTSGHGQPIGVNNNARSGVNQFLRCKDSKDLRGFLFGKFSGSYVHGVRRNGLV